MIRPFCLIACVLFAAPPAAAEWLVFRDGSTREIQGPWQVVGRQVRFKSKGGVLQAARLDEIDLAASEQLSKNASPDRGLVEVESSPTEAYDWKQVASGTRVTPLGDGTALVQSWKRYTGKYVGTHPGLECTPSRLVAVTSGTDWWLQTGTRVQRFRLLGLAEAKVEQLKTLVPEGLLCVESDPRVPSPTKSGQLVGYARLADGRDIGLELLRAKAATLAEEGFSRRDRYLKALAGK